MTVGRMPDLIIPGAMKCGTTTLYGWLDGHPGVSMGPKEIHFFSDDDLFARGFDWYSGQFPAGPELTGEASTTYLDPAHAANAAARISELIPDVRLVCILRNPLERLRSHYRHDTLRSRETRPLREAVTEPGNAYVRRSSYAAGLEPYVERFPDGLLALTFEDLFGSHDDAWRALLRFLELQQVPRPAERRNVSARKRQFTRPMLWLWERDLVDPIVSLLPRTLRRVAGRLLLRSGPGVERALERSRASLPEETVDVLAIEAERLARLLGWGAVPWEMTPSTGAAAPETARGSS